MDALSDKTTCVVVATDGSEPATAAVEWAAREAASRGETLLVVTACPPIQMPPSSVSESGAVTMMSYWADEARMQNKEHHEIVLAAADRARKLCPDLVVTTEVFEGDPRSALELYERLASLVVLGSRGLGSIRTLLLGSVSFWATRHLTVPFVVVRPADPDQLAVPHGIAVGISAETNSESILRVAFEMAARRDCSLTVANAEWDSQATANEWSRVAAEDVDPGRRRSVADLVEQIGSEFPAVSYTIMFARGRVDRFLTSVGSKHEALVVGRRTSTLLDFIGLGTLASAVIEHSTGATVVIPLEGAKS